MHNHEHHVFIFRVLPPAIIDAVFSTLIDVHIRKFYVWHIEVAAFIAARHHQI